MSARGAAASRVYETVKRDLLDGQIRPGERIGDEDLRERLSVSRTPVREAMLALEKEQLVRIVPRQGYFAAEISHADVVDAYQLRFLLEPIATAMAARRFRDSDIEQLRELAHVSLDGSDASVTDAIDRNKQFHVLVCEVAGNGRITRAMSEALDALGRMAVLDLQKRRTGESWTAEHLVIVDAIASGDPARAAAAARATFEPDEGVGISRTRADITEIAAAVYASEGDGNGAV
jgi:DNA-binding GntR family transcriptional regulator